MNIAISGLKCSTLKICLSKNRLEVGYLGKLFDVYDEKVLPFFAFRSSNRQDRGETLLFVVELSDSNEWLFAITGTNVHFADPGVYLKFSFSGKAHPELASIRLTRIHHAETFFPLQQWEGWTNLDASRFASTMRSVHPLAASVELLLTNQLLNSFMSDLIITGLFESFFTFQGVPGFTTPNPLFNQGHESRTFVDVLIDHSRNGPEHFQELSFVNLQEWQRKSFQLLCLKLNAFWGTWESRCLQSLGEQIYEQPIWARPITLTVWSHLESCSLLS